ncbi:MAG: M23 family metallopeptidase [Clostridiales bacterium]|nr:M23 family metallopeptidase [Clostridiales bacterium]
MEQELRYARLLEIPVESCTVITKKSKKRTHVAEERLKNKAIEEVNRQAEAAEAVEKQEPESADVSRQELPPSPTEIAVVSAVASEGETRVETAPEREEVSPTPPLLEGKRAIETRVPEIPLRFAPVLESAEGALEEDFLATSDTAGEDYNLDSALPVCEIIEELPEERVVENAYLPPRKKRSVGLTLTAVVCALLSFAFLLNAFVFRLDLAGLVTGSATLKKEADNRLRGEFSLTLPTAGAFVIENGVMQFSDKGGVYATEDGKVTSLTADETGTYTMEISHSDLFKTVITGVSTPFNKVGDTVYRAQPVAYGLGETVSVSFYENGEQLICAVEEGTLKV